MISETGISLISYCGPISSGSRRCRRANERVCEYGLDSSVAKLCIWDRLLTFIRLGDADDDSSGDCSEPIGDCCAEEVEEEGSGRGGAAWVPAGVDCCELGRNRGLGGGTAREDCCELVTRGLGSGALGCCDLWFGVELGAGLGSAMETSAGGAARSDGLVFTCEEGRTGL